MILNLALNARPFPRSGIGPAVANAAAAAAVVTLWASVAGSAAAADIQHGASLYSTHCAVCHGSNGTPVMPGAPNFRRIESLMRPDMHLLAVIRKGKGAMPGYFGVLRDRDILDVIAHLRTLN